MLRRALCLLSLCLWPLLATAETYPDYVSTDINDFANLLVDEEVRDRLRDRLVTLRQNTGIEMTVVTLPTQDDYAPLLTLEDFATRLFNRWGIGNAARNDGIMVLVLPQDRAMRIELGAGYARDWDYAAQIIVDREFLPHFRNEDYQGGIEAGVAAVIERIALPFNTGAPALEVPEDTSLPWYSVPIFGGVILLVALRNVIGGIFTRFCTCPSCGRKGTLRSRRVTVMMATTNIPGQGERTVWCVACDYRNVTTYRISRIRRSSSSSGGFGGGRSGGGGASGRW